MIYWLIVFLISNAFFIALVTLTYMELDLAKVVSIDLVQSKQIFEELFDKDASQF